MQDGERHAERVVGEHGSRDLVWRADDFAAHAKAPLELVAKAPEQVDVLGLLRGEAEQRAHAVVVAAQQRAGVIEHERQDELLYQAENAQVSVGVAVGADVESGGPLARTMVPSVGARTLGQGTLLF